MSDYTFPALPGLDVQSISRAPAFATKVLRSQSGKEIRVGWRTSSIVTYRMRFNFLRDNVAAPSPWEARSELKFVQYWHRLHVGALDSWLLTDPSPDPEVGSPIRVHFLSDELELRQVVPGVWEGELLVESVL